MQQAHLNDEELQTFLDKKETHSSEAALHLARCEECRSRLEQYKMLYTHLHTYEEDFSLSPAFSSKVMRKIMRKSLFAILGNSWEAILISMGCIGAALGVYFNIDMNSIFTTIGSTLSPNFEIHDSIITPISSILANFNIDSHLLFFAAVALIFIFTFNHILFRSKSNHRSLLNGMKLL